MSATIWKFPIHGTHMLLSFPAGTHFIAGQMQDGTPTLWGIVDPSREYVIRGARVVGTGHDLDPATLDWQTFTMQDGHYVWHVFVQPEATP